MVKSLQRGFNGSCHESSQNHQIHYTCSVIDLNEQNGNIQFLLQQTWKIMKNMHSDACYNHLLVWLRAIYVLDGWINMML